MANNSLKVSELPTAANVASTDRIVVLRDPTGSPSVRTVTLSNFSANIVLSNTAPANSTANGTQGNIRFDANNIYICVSNNVWKRSTLASW